ncbi:MAG: serine--tRNA ligase, partial [Yaniella sp.]|nr:serine--tRNA ligase [Yaniella sp.]
MIDVKHLAENPDLYRASQRAREDDESLVDQIITADADRRAALQAFERLRAEQNVVSKKIGQASGDEKQALLGSVKELSANVKTAEAQADAATRELEALNNRFPNLIVEGIPSGGEENFAVLKEVGDVPQFEFEPRDHLELGELLGAIDMERGAKVSGSRFYFLKGVGAQLEMALTQMGMAQAAEAGFTPIITPTLVRPETMNGTGFNVEHDDEIYRIEKDDLYLVGTS